MTTQMATYTELIERLTPEVTLTLHGINWETYEELLAAVGEAPALRVSYDDGVMQIMSVSFEHEYFAEFLNHLAGRLSAVLRLKILFFGRAAMKKQKKLKGAEPDACFYVRSAAIIGNKFRLDLSVDPPPDIVVEIDLHHDSLSKLPIYAALGVPEVWRYDGQTLTIYQLQTEQYVTAPVSHALPVLTSQVLTAFLQRSQQEDQYETLLAFEEWLRAQPQ